jgi:cell wall-associated NlpC family hydrolase
MHYGKLVTTLILITLLPLTLPGCGMFRKSGTPVKPFSTGSSDILMAKDLLYLQYDEWKSVRYREGGMSKEGIDCSGFVYHTYLTKFGIELPRSTDLQAKLGKEVAPNSMQAGDLVFFKTGLSMKHVGIYLEDRKFLHASTRKGITISSLDEQYWSRNYWMAKRISL